MTFEAFWTVWPRKVARRDAEKAWKQLNPSEALAAEILMDVQAKAQSIGWLKENRAFCPYPASYIRGRRWEDSDQTPPNATKTPPKRHCHWCDTCDAPHYWEIPECPTCGFGPEQTCPEFVAKYNEAKARR